MQDEKDRESDEKPSGEERRSSPLKPYSKPATPPEEAETISLLDLMAEESEGQGQKTIVLPPEAKTVELPPLVPSGSSTRPSQPTSTTDDQATPTATIRPPEPADTAPTPTTRDRAERPTFDAPESTPTVDDLEATTVQPRVAFPGATQVRPPAKPGSESTTYIGARPSPARRPPAAPPGQRQAAPPTTQPKREQRPPQPPPSGRRPAPPPSINTKAKRPMTAGRIGRGLFVTLLVLFVVGLLAASAAAIGYSLVAADLPRPTELRNRASTFETARIYDRNGQLLYALADPNAGNRTYVPLDRISPYLVQATIATEDKRFYDNPGFDVIGLVRAVVEAAREGEAVAGTSTITQQLVRATLLDEDERTERSYRRKVREIILAAEISRTYSKEEILELYLNEIYYGNLAYGIEAAANTYFNKSAADLTLAEASLLAGLPGPGAVGSLYRPRQGARSPAGSAQPDGRQ